MAFAVVLTGKGFAANRADKGALVSMRSQMGAEVVGSCEAFGAECALKICRMFYTAVGASSGGPIGIGEFEDVVAVGD